MMEASRDSSSLRVQCVASAQSAMGEHPFQFAIAKTPPATQTVSQHVCATIPRALSNMNELSSLEIQQIDARDGDVTSVLSDLRTKLSPRGNVVSEAGRQKTIEVFGKPLTPQQVVETICVEVRDRGLEAVLEIGRAHV